LDSAKPTRSKLWLILLIVLAVVIIGCLVWWFTRAPAVAAVKVQWSPLVRTLQFSARVATDSRVEVGSAITGRVTQVLVVEGAQVKKGDELIRLETDELHAALVQAKAGESQANSKLDGLRTTARAVVDAAVTQADSTLLKTQSELRRTQALTDQGFLSQARLEEALSVAMIAKAQRASAFAQSFANRGTELAQAQSQISVAHAASAAATARLAQGVVIAPADAKVLTRLVEPGQIVQPGRALISLALAGPVLLIAQVDERYLEQLQTGQAASVVADAFPSQRFAAQMQVIAPLVDAQRGAVQVKLVVLGQAPAFLREDMTLSVEVETARRDRALVVPVEALHGDEAASTATVLVDHNGRAQERIVRVGIRTLKLAQIDQGLTEGETVITGGTLKAGSRLRAQLPVPGGIVKEKPAKSASGAGGMP
jgi:HlyD family secretion protein